MRSGTKPGHTTAHTGISAGVAGARWFHPALQMQRFPYGVIYEPAVTEIIVVAIAHLHREPGYWQGRVPHP